MDTSELHRASGGSTDINLPTLLQVKIRAPKGTTGAFPTFPGERIQAVAAGILHSGFPQGNYCTAGSIQSCSCVFPYSPLHIPWFVRNCFEKHFTSTKTTGTSIFSSSSYPHPLKESGKFDLCYIFLSKPEKSTRNAASISRYSFKLPRCKVWCWRSHSNQSEAVHVVNKLSLFVLSFPEIFPSNFLSKSLTLKKLLPSN